MRETNFLDAAVVVQCISVIVLGLIWKRRRRLQGNHTIKRCGVHPINQQRDSLGHFTNLYMELRQHPDRFFSYTRLTVRQFDLLLSMVGPRLLKNSTYRRPLPPAMRLVITLRFLASGDSPLSLALAYRIGKSTCTTLINETTPILWEVLRHKYLKPPTKEDYVNIGEDFFARWNLPHCLGAIDGKHIVIQCPPKSSSEYFSYKKSFSIVLLAVCDANYCFTYVDIGCYGSVSDGGVMRTCILGKKLYSNTLDIPQPKQLPDTDHGNSSPFPYYFVGDEAFPLKMNLLTPFGKAHLGPQYPHHRVFNYRLSRGRRIIENSFGILAARWRIFHTVIAAEPQNAENIVKAAVCLHNFLQKNSENGEACAYTPDAENASGDVNAGEWRVQAQGNNLQRLPIRAGRNAYKDATDARERLSHYFCNEGSVPWQMDIVTRGGVR